MIADVRRSLVVVPAKLCLWLCAFVSTYLVQLTDRVHYTCWFNWAVTASLTCIEQNTVSIVALLWIVLHILFYVETDQIHSLCTAKLCVCMMRFLVEVFRTANRQTAVSTHVGSIQRWQPTWHAFNRTQSVLQYCCGQQCIYKNRQNYSSAICVYCSTISNAVYRRSGKIIERDESDGGRRQRCPHDL